jgi:hypothetical protein
MQALSTPTACQLDRHEWWPLEGYPGACLPLLRPTVPVILHTPSSDPLAITDHWPCISIPSQLIIHENPRNRKVHHRFAFALLLYHSIAQLFLVCPHRLQLHPSIVLPSRLTVTLILIDFPHPPACFTGLAWELRCRITAAPPFEGFPLSDCVVPSLLILPTSPWSGTRTPTYPFFYRSSLPQDSRAIELRQVRYFFLLPLNFMFRTFFIAALHLLSPTFYVPQTLDFVEPRQAVISDVTQFPTDFTALVVLRIILTLYSHRYKMVRPRIRNVIACINQFPIYFSFTTPPQFSVLKFGPPFSSLVPFRNNMRLLPRRSRHARTAGISIVAPPLFPHHYPTISATAVPLDGVGSELPQT